MEAKTLYSRFAGSCQLACGRLAGKHHQQFKSPPYEVNENWLQMLSVLLHEPLARCRMIARNNLRHTANLEKRRHSRQPAGQIRIARETTSWPTARQYTRYCHHIGRSYIIAACHFGDYVHRLNRLAMAGPSGLRHLLISERHPGPESLANLLVDFGQMGISAPEILLSREVNVLMLRQVLKYQRCALTSFFDLPASHGQVLPVMFLGQKAWFSGGLAALAVSAGVSVVPVVTYKSGNRHCIAVGSVVEPETFALESFDEATIRMTQQLVNWLSGWLLRFPEQWRYLPDLHAYFQPPEKENRDE